MAKTKELVIHDTAHIEEIQQKSSTEKQSISTQEEKIIDKMSKHYDEKTINPEEVILGPAGIYDPSKKTNGALVDLAKKVKEGMKEYSKIDPKEVILGPAGIYESTKETEKSAQPKEQINSLFEALSASGQHVSSEETKNVIQNHVKER